METFCSISIGWFRQAINLLFLKNIRTLDIVSKVGHLFDVCYCCFYLWSFCFLCMQELVENMYIRLSLFFIQWGGEFFFCNRESLNCTFWDFLPTVDPCSWKDERLRYRCQTPHKVTCQNFRDPGLCYRTILLHTNQKMYYYSLYTWAG